MLLFILFPIVLSQTQVCQTSDFNSGYKKGDHIVLCLFFQTADNQQYRQVYQLKVDQYTALLVSGAYQTLSSKQSNLWANSGSISTVYGTPYTQSGGAFPIQSIVVQMIQGSVIDVFWDNVCFDGSQCKENSITTTTGQSVSENNDFVTSCSGGACDPKVYVSFLGTDANGQYFTSNGIRMSKFRQYSAAQIFTNTQNAFNSVIDEYSNYTISTK
ncbi:unnamed protein product [Paramecium octaurelia]|uniref:Uncharacterized protein n=1 Tax=Paramecium octaurelia TaxID=43137 RepID=A0A8S1VQ03_PAROT|nr:unnamed protein product [Paramecium octaurelia]